MHEQRKHVRFDLSRPRSPDPEERYALKHFCQHVLGCSRCVLSESRGYIRCRLCSSGQWCGDELRVYLEHRDGFYYAKVRPQVPVHLGADFESARTYLRYAAACRNRSPAHTESTTRRSTAETHPQAESSLLAFVQPPSLTITPYLSSVVADPKSGETLLYLTVPSFTVPVRIRVTNKA